MTEKLRSGAALTAAINANEQRYARTSAARNRARQRECVDGCEFTVDELVAEQRRLKILFYARNPHLKGTT